MKIEEIHNNLSDNEVRDFLAKSIGYSNPSDEYYLVRAIERLERSIVNLNDMLTKAKNNLAVVRLVKNRGWRIYEIESNIEYIYPDTYHPFIGTEEEYQELLKKSEKS